MLAEFPWLLAQPPSPAIPVRILGPGLACGRALGPAFAVAALRRHHKRQIEERLRVGPSWLHVGYVFTTGIGTPIDASGGRPHGGPRPRP